MAAVALEHSDLERHQVDMMRQQRRLWVEGRFCDVALRSRDGKEHRAHASVLCAASTFFDSLLGGSFLEADQVQLGQPVEVAASDATVHALLEYIYGGQPEVPWEDSIELLRLADAYHLPALAAAAEAGLRASLDNHQGTADIADLALKILRQTQGLYGLRAACEVKVAAHFVACMQHPDFLKLSGSQLAKILESPDLSVPREEEALKGLMKWLKGSKDRADVFAVLLRNVDFRSISFGNLARTREFASSMGPIGDDLQREVDEALLAGKKRSQLETPDSFRPKRRCFQRWSPELGASCEGSVRRVVSTSFSPESLSLHEDAIYADQGDIVLCWKPGDVSPRVVAGQGWRADGIKLSESCHVSVSPSGPIIVADLKNRRLVSIEDGFGKLVLADVENLRSVFCSPNGVIYVLNCRGRAVQKLVGATLEPVFLSEHLPSGLQFVASRLFVTSEEVIYLSDHVNRRVLRFSLGDTTPVIVGQVPDENSNLQGLYVTEDGTIYAADSELERVWAFHPGSTAPIEVVRCPTDAWPWTVLVHDQLLYVSQNGGEWGRGIYEYSLPPALQLE
ncbi:kbtbd8 [Symbiodinium natans]|uniref:Kbtbd8 protein n=1 Tax=Symbiodinium natans TaxID=878477 RepID=A0A812I3B5_9DINO|nr:kbtbd8 [Symbiodinium natans]